MSDTAKRTLVAALMVSAAAGTAWIAAEGDGPLIVRDDGVVLHKPYVPTQGDVPTIAHGSTHYEDGTRVKLTDPPITRERARDLALGELDRTYAACVRRSLPQARMSQTEFDIATDFAGQFGCATWSASSMRRYTAAGQYAQACESYKLYKLMPAGRRGPGPGLVLVRGAWKQDCSYPGNRICAGVWTRQLKRYEQCANGLEEFRQIRAGGVE